MNNILRRTITIAGGVAGGITGATIGLSEGIKFSLFWEKNSHKATAVTVLTVGGGLTGTALGIAFGSMLPITLPLSLYYLYRKG